jgi:hypothetical protein
MQEYDSYRPEEWERESRGCNTSENVLKNPYFDTDIYEIMCPAVVIINRYFSFPLTTN